MKIKQKKQNPVNQDKFSILNGMLQKRIIPPYKEVLVKERDPVPVFLLGDPVYHVLPLLVE